VKDHPFTGSLVQTPCDEAGEEDVEEDGGTELFALGF